MSLWWVSSDHLVALCGPQLVEQDEESFHQDTSTCFLTGTCQHNKPLFVQQMVEQAAWPLHPSEMLNVSDYSLWAFFRTKAAFTMALIPPFGFSPSFINQAPFCSKAPKP